MSEAENVQAQGYIKLHNRKDDRPILFNAAKLVLICDTPKISKDLSLKVESASAVKAFGESPFVVRETVEEIANIIKATGLEVYQQDKGDD
jgi:hypothetical protein